MIRCISGVVCSALLLLFHTSFNYVRKPDWELQRCENGISLYTRSQPGSAIKEVRVVNRTKSTLSAIVALLLETRNYPQWIYGCIESSPLKVISSKELYNYQVTDLPWPCSDRDVICRFIISQESSSGIITLTKSSVPEFIPEKKSCVRLYHFESCYRLIPLDNDSVQVELEVSIDPRGNIPAWMVNANLVTGPFKTTEAMIQQLPRYQSVTYPFITEKNN